MAKEAERLLADSGWLPEPLRMVDDGIEVDPASGAAAEADDLPDFLTGDGEDDPADDEEDPATDSVQAPVTGSFAVSAHSHG